MKLADVEMIVLHTTERAVLASPTGEREDAVWLPLAQIEVAPANDGRGKIITMPEWLMKEKGLI